MNRKDAFKIAKAEDSRVRMDLDFPPFPPYPTLLDNTNLNSLHIFRVEPTAPMIGASDYIAIRKSDGTIFRFQSGE